MSGNRGDLTKVLQGIEAAEKAGFTPIKINVVVQSSLFEKGEGSHPLPESETTRDLLLEEHAGPSLGPLKGEQNPPRPMEENPGLD